MIRKGTMVSLFNIQCFNCLKIMKNFTCSAVDMLIMLNTDFVVIVMQVTWRTHTDSLRIVTS